MENFQNELDVSDYIQNIEIKSSKGKGRGIFATKDFKQGELIILEKSFADCNFTNERDVVSA